MIFSLKKILRNESINVKKNPWLFILDAEKYMYFTTFYFTRIDVKERLQEAAFERLLFLREYFSSE